MRNVKNKLGAHYNSMFVEEKIIALAALVAIAGCLFNWSSWNVADRVFTDNGFSGKTWLIGWFITIFSLIAILIALLPKTEEITRKFGFGRMTLAFFLGLEGFFLAMIAVSVLGYSEYLTQELDTGIFITLLATAFVALGGFAGMRRGLATRPRPSLQSDFLQFQEPKREHNLHNDDILSPEEDENNLEEEDEKDEDDDKNQQTLNLD